MVLRLTDKRRLQLMSRKAQWLYKYQWDSNKRWKLIIKKGRDVTRATKGKPWKMEWVLKSAFLWRLWTKERGKKIQNKHRTVQREMWNERRADLLCSAGGCEAQPSRPSSWSAWMISAHLHPQQGAYLARGDKNTLTSPHTQHIQTLFSYYHLNRLLCAKLGKTDFFFFFTASRKTNTIVNLIIIKNNNNKK